MAAGLIPDYEIEQHIFRERAAARRGRVHARNEHMQSGGDDYGDLLLLHGLNLSAATRRHGTRTGEGEPTLKGGEDVQNSQVWTCGLLDALPLNSPLVDSSSSQRSLLPSCSKVVWIMFLFMLDLVQL